MKRKRIKSAAIMFAGYLAAFCVSMVVNGTFTTPRFVIGVMVALTTAIIGELTLGAFMRQFDRFEKKQ